MRILASFAFGCCLLVVACVSEPSTRMFLLASPAVSNDQRASAGVPMQVQTVLVPDYLDTTDILMRTGLHEVVASTTGRWGERLSLGMTHALQARLAARLPSFLVTLTPPASQNAAQLVVTVDAFDLWPNGHCTLSAHWTILERATGAIGRVGRGWFTGLPVSNADDAARVATMASVVDQLSARIASELPAGGGA